MTERDRTPDLARAVAAFDDETRDSLAQALWMEELDNENQTVELQFAISEAGGRHFQAEPVVPPATSGLVGYQSPARLPRGTAGGNGGALSRRRRPDLRRARGLRAARPPEPPGGVVQIGKKRRAFLVLPIRGMSPGPPRPPAPPGRRGRSRGRPRARPSLSRPSSPSLPCVRSDAAHPCSPLSRRRVAGEAQRLRPSPDSPRRHATRGRRAGEGWLSPHQRPA